MFCNPSVCERENQLNITQRHSAKSDVLSNLMKSAFLQTEVNRKAQSLTGLSRRVDVIRRRTGRTHRSRRREPTHGVAWRASRLLFLELRHLLLLLVRLPRALKSVSGRGGGEAS